MADYETLYKKLAQAVVKAEGKIGEDAAAFVADFVAKLRSQGWRIDAEAEAALNNYFNGMETAIKSALAESIVISSGSAVTAASLQSEVVLLAAERAFVERWPDGLALSDRLWKWQNSTRDAVAKQLQSGIRQGAATSRVLYDMQRAIETDAGSRFKLVSDHTDEWVEEFYQSAQAVIANPAMRKDWQDVVNDVESRIVEMSKTGSRTAAERLLSQIKNAVEKGREELLDSAVKWWAYDKQLYHLNRIVRTEMATAAHRAVIDTSIDNPGIIGYQWRLSASHPVIDICDYYANIEMGLGKGVWTKEAVPRHKAHPHCMCLLIPRATPIKQKGERNYADFIRNTTKDRRDQLLPEWVKDAVKKGVPLDDLIRADGLDLLSKAEAIKLGRIDKGLPVDDLARLDKPKAKRAVKPDPEAEAVARFNKGKDYVLKNGIENQAGSIEFAYAYDGDGNVLIQKKGIKSEVNFTADELKRLKSAKDVVFIHNHPASRSLSPQDFTFADNANCDMYAIGHNGLEYYGKILNREKFDALYKRIDKSLTEQFWERIKNGSLMPLDAERLHHHAINSILREIGAVEYQVKGDIQETGSVTNVIGELSKKFSSKRYAK